MFSLEILLLIVSILIILCILIFKFFDYLGIPVLLLFLGIGILAGAEGIGRINFDDARLAQSIGIVALVFILFAGGLDTNWNQVKPIFKHAIVLSTFGVFATAILVGFFASFVLKIPILYCIMLGSIVSSTDAPAVFSILRSKNVKLKGTLKPLLELESGSNDPMAIFLTIASIQLINSSANNPLQIMTFFILQMGLGAVIGLTFGKLVVFILNRLRLFYEGLYPVFCLASAFLIYGITYLLNGSGFLAVYLAGIVIGNSQIVKKKSLLRFFDGLAWLSQITMFLTLGLLVYPSHLLPVTGAGILLSIFLMFVARPISVFLSLFLSKYSLRERLFVAWVGLRGAVPIILATFPLLSGIQNAELIFNLVFFIVLTSALFQGWSIPIISKILGVSAPLENKRASPIEFEPPPGVDTELIELIVPFESEVVNKPIVEIGFPQDCLIVLIVRGENFIVPSGGTILEPGDTLLFLANKNSLKKINEILHKWKGTSKKDD
ncbi:MAG: potassium/proton antiporter [candidate division WOR-3 bacterium]